MISVTDADKGIHESAPSPIYTPFPNISFTLYIYTDDHRPNPLYREDTECYRFAMFMQIDW